MSVLVVLVALALTGGITLAMVPVLDALADRQQARSAADAAALAGVSGGRHAAARIAASNDAQLVAWSSTGDVVTVVVRVDGQTASARATDGR